MDLTMIFFLLFLTLNAIIFYQSKIYYNSDLGISFDYSNTDYTPFDFNSDSARYSSISDWNSFQSKILRISFSYPKGTKIKDDKHNDFYGDNLIDTTIYIGYRNSIDTSKFYPVTTIYKSSDSFESIAEHLFFEKDTTGIYSEWIILGRGLPQDATYFEGNNCRGLRGHTFLGFYHCEGGYAGISDVYRTLLVLELSANEKVVLFYDSAGTWDCIEEEGNPYNDIWEDEFFKVAASIKILE